MPSEGKKPTTTHHCLTAYLAHGPLKLRETFFGAVLYVLSRQQQP